MARVEVACKDGTREKHKHKNVMEHAFMEMEMYVDQIRIIGDAFYFIQ